VNLDGDVGMYAAAAAGIRLRFGRDPEITPDGKRSKFFTVCLFGANRYDTFWHIIALAHWRLVYFALSCFVLGPVHRPTPAIRGVCALFLLAVALFVLGSYLIFDCAMLVLVLLFDAVLTRFTRCSLRRRMRTKTAISGLRRNRCRLSRLSSLSL
jgi:hypothetical protein